ncbi:MAG: hypothetical protein ACRD8W_06825 [Nitrososphaeraceae archaeon]
MKNQILIVGLVAAVTLVVTQTTLVSEVDAAKEFQTDCIFLPTQSNDVEQDNVNL